MNEESYKVKGYPEIRGIIDLVALLLFLLLPIFVRIITGETNALFLILLGFITMVAILISHSFGYVVNADKDNVNLKKRFFWIVFFDKTYTYDEVITYKWDLEKHNSRYHKYYLMIFNLGFSDGEEIRLCKRMYWKFNIDKKNPDKFVSLVWDESMVQLRDYILAKKTKAFFDKHPEFKEEESPEE